MKAIVLETVGGPDHLRLLEVPDHDPGPHEVLVEIAAAGVNYMDIGTRVGMYSIAPLPMTPGVEGAGRIAAVGENVRDLKVGDRVAWFFAVGSYAERIIAPADAMVPVPDDIDLKTAAALLMQGLTASHLVSDTYAIKPGDVALVHSAAGGVGLMLTQLIKLRGGRVIGRVSSREKVELARAAGADHVVVDGTGDFADEVLHLTDGAGAHVVYDGAGADTFQGSLASLRYHGVLAYYGQTIKRQPPIDLLDLPKSVLVTYPVVHHHVRTRSDLLGRSQALFDRVREGSLKVRIGHQYPLAEAAQAHTDIASRRTTGKLLLVS
ncbi:quinone oxidoreductase (plasmid) [Microvirga terrae]|uniref:Quinone oxidoreductase n=1 Tax=Microvirga terrae TaxID=2740529 RepID=A0ABY5S158_9HYPH|nr:quinone oxidoreductase [Microvirga terrae]UVF22832.1 quinone oxidoreductase [Microvirga terrae]